MATENNTIETKVILDASQAQQEIVKLNAVASDSTKTLEERISAKNKQTEIQEKLNKQTIAGLENEVKALTGVVGKEKELDQASKKLTNTKLKATKQETALIKQSNSLRKSYNAQQGAVNKLDNATGGMITSFKALAANPIVLMITLLVGLFKLLKEAFTSSEEGQDKWNKAMGVASALLGNLMDLVAEVAEALVWMFTNPREALESFGNFIKTNISNRIDGLIEIIPKLGSAISLVFKGKFAEAGKVALDAMGKVALGVDSVTDSIDGAKNALGEFIKEQEKEAEAAGEVADMRAKADRIDRKLKVERSVLDAKIADLRLKAKQEEKFSAAERKVFLQEALDIGDQLLAKELKSLELRRDAQSLENTFSRSNKENLDAEAEAIAAVNNQQTARLNLARQIESENKRVNGQIRTENKKKEAEAAKLEKAAMDARAKEIKGFQEQQAAFAEIEKQKKQREADEAEVERQLLAENAEKDREARNEIDLLEIERKRESGELTLQEELDFLIRKRDQELEQLGLTALEKEAIEKNYQNVTDKLQAEAVKRSKASDNAMLESGIAMAAEAFGVSKEAAIALALIKAPEAIGAVWARAADKKTIPQIALHGAVGTAMVLAPIAKSLSTIKKTKMKGRAGGRGSGGGGGTIAAPQGVSATAVGDLSANNAANLGAETALENSATAAASNNVSGSSGGNVVFSEGAYNDFQDQVNFVEGQTTMD